MDSYKKSFVGILLCSILFPIISKGEVVDGINYQLSGSNAYVIAHTSETGEYTGDVIIPETIAVNGEIYTVTQINSGAFTESSISSISIPATVTTIKNEIASELTNLKQLIFKDGETDLTFGNGSSDNFCFKDCQMENIYIGRNLIPKNSGKCYLMSSGINSKIGTFTFSESIVKFPDNVFYGSYLLDSNNRIFEFPEGIQELGQYSLNISNLGKLIFPSTLRKIASVLTDILSPDFDSIILESKAKEPMAYPYSNSSPFNNYKFEQLIVPYGCVQNYIDAGWSVVAKEIVEAEEESENPGNPENPEIVYLRLKMPLSSEGYCYPIFEISSGEDFSLVFEVESGWTISQIAFESEEDNSDSQDNVRRYEEVGDDLSSAKIEKIADNHYKISISNISTSGSLSYILEKEMPTEVKTLADNAKKPVVVPAQDSISVSAAAGSVVSVYNVNGVLLKTGTVGESSSLTFGGLGRGIYIVKADSYIFKLAL